MVLLATGLSNYHFGTPSEKPPTKPVPDAVWGGRGKMETEKQGQAGPR